MLIPSKYSVFVYNLHTETLPIFLIYLMILHHFQEEVKLISSLYCLKWRTTNSITSVFTIYTLNIEQIV